MYSSLEEARAALGDQETLKRVNEALKKNAVSHLQLMHNPSIPWEWRFAAGKTTKVSAERGLRLRSIGEYVYPTERTSYE